MAEARSLFFLTCPRYGRMHALVLSPTHKPVCNVTLSSLAGLCFCKGGMDSKLIMCCGVDFLWRKSVVAQGTEEHLWSIHILRQRILNFHFESALSHF